MPESPDPTVKKRSRGRSWAILVSVFAGLWFFAVWAGPWLESRIPVFNRIVETIEKQDIDSGAYFYTEIKASYDGEQYLKSALTAEQTRVSLPFLSGVFICVLLLVVGFKYLPND